MFSVDPQTIFAGTEKFTGRYSHVEQRWNGVPISGPSSGARYYNAKPDEDLLIKSEEINTHAWSLNSVPTISSTTAISIARREWLGHGAFVSEITTSRLAIEVGIYHRCGTPMKPALVWDIRGASSFFSEPICFVDAHTGDVCGWCDDVTSFQIGI
jgi:hypothetical protein